MKYFLIITFLLFVNNFAQEKDENIISSDKLSGLRFRSIGPALISGRIIDFAVNEEKPWEYYTAVASGGVWKTVNGGVTYEPVFDSEGSYSIGCVALDPNNQNVVWVGTGENNSQRSVGYGDGLYKSIDGGKSWKKMGLDNSEHIGKIVIDPRDSDIVFVAAQGPLWGPGGDRGLFKTVDGGKTWEKILNISQNTGVSDLVYDPRNPDVMYASSYQRRRHVFTLINGGPESALYKTTDAGKTWEKLTKGLPNGDLGRIGIAVSPVNPDYVYAIVEAADNKGGFFRSIDMGASFNKMSNRISSSPQYYQEIICDPINVEKVYVLDTYTSYTMDGGKTFTNFPLDTRHVDDHALWINPKAPNYMILGGDGGIYESWDGGIKWEFKRNLPVVQFYKVAVDNSEPFYFVYGGTQDNNSIGGPSATQSATGIVNEDWFITNGGDGFEAAVDPLNPNIVYTQSQYGWLTRLDRKTGEKVGIKPIENDDTTVYRWNWDSPLIISPHKHSRLYFAANVLFKSDDMGNSWEKISDDLTRQLDRNKLRIMGKLWSVDTPSKNASTSQYGNITAIAESPLQEGLLYTGSDDGLFHVSMDGGLNWNKISTIDGVPDTTYINDIIASRHSVNRVYVAFNNHKRADFKPYIAVSENSGKTWKILTKGLPERGSVYSLEEDFKNENLIFAGTEFGFYFSIDRGENWIELTNGLPTIAVRDIEIQERESDLVLATFGRGFYILDNYDPLRHFSEEIFNADAYFFPVKDANQFIKFYPMGGNGAGNQGDDYYFAENPSYGAVFTYYIKKGEKTLKQLRQKKESELNKENKDVPYPTYDELKAEDDEIGSYLLFSIFNEKGEIIRRLQAPVSEGLQRIVWDLRNFDAGEAKPDEKSDINKESGWYVQPGKYYVILEKYSSDSIIKLAQSEMFNVRDLFDYQASPQEQIVKFREELKELIKKYSYADNKLNELNNNLSKSLNALKNSAAEVNNYITNIHGMQKRVKDISRKLKGDNTLSSRDIDQNPSVADRIGTIGWEQSRALKTITNTHLMSKDLAEKQLESILGEIDSLESSFKIEILNYIEKVSSNVVPGIKLK